MRERQHCLENLVCTSSLEEVIVDNIMRVVFVLFVFVGVRVGWGLGASVDSPSRI